MTDTAQQAPYALEAEQALLGALLLEPRTLPDIQAIIKAEMFFLKRHGLIYQAMIKTAKLGVLDYITISQTLSEMKALDEIGGQAYLTSLVNETPSAMHVEVYAGIVERSHRRRKYMQASDEMRRLALDEEINIDQVAGEIETLVSSVNADAPLHRSKTAFDVADGVYEQIIAGSNLLQDNPQYIYGIATGYRLLDWKIDGILPGYVTTLAGETGIGKTAIVCNIALNAACSGYRREETRPANVVIFSGEMHENDLGRRMISIMSNVNARDIRRGFPNTPAGKQDRRRAEEAVATFSQLPIVFETGQRLSTSGLRSVVRRYLSQNKLDLLILDSILQVDPKVNKAKQEQDWLKINSVLEDLEEIAQTFNIPILATAQIGRSGYNTKPTLGNIKRGSAIEEKSAVVLLMYRTEDEDQNGNRIIALDIAKHRHGENSQVRFVYDNARTEFHEIDERQITGYMGV